MRKERGEKMGKAKEKYDQLSPEKQAEIKERREKMKNMTPEEKAIE